MTLRMARTGPLGRGLHGLGPRPRRTAVLTRPARSAHPLMSDPFVPPEEPTAAEAIAAIGDELDVFDDWMDRYQFIIELGRKLPAFSGAMGGRRPSGAGLPEPGLDGGELCGTGQLFLAGISDAAIVSGLIALLLRVYSGREPEEILATDPVFLKDLGLLEALSTNRGNGIAAMARKIREVAALQSA